MLTERIYMHVPAGGPSTINGVLYQMLWSLFRTTELHLLTCGINDQTGVIADAVVLLEPSGGGGDLQVLGTPKLVDQVKSRPDGGTWSLKEVIEEVFPDLYRAANPEETSISYRLVTEGRLGQWGKAYEFFRSLRNLTYAPLALDNIAEVYIPGNTGSSVFWEKQDYTGRHLFEKIFETIRHSRDVKKKESPEDTRRKLWHLLGHFEFVGGRTQSVIQKELDGILLALVNRDSDLPRVRDAMLLDLSRRATSGDAMIQLSSFMSDHGLDSIPWTEWAMLCQRSRALLLDALDRRRYDLEKDVRYDDVREAATKWSDAPLLLVSGESGQGKSWFLYAVAHALSNCSDLVILTEATGDLDKTLEHVEHGFRFIRNADEALPLDRIAARLPRLPGCPKKPWLTLIIDGVQDMEEARRISLAPWAKWGVRVAVSCQEEVADWIEENASGQCRKLTVSDFTAGELHSYLNQALGRHWAELPGDVRNTLRRPLLASTFVQEFTKDTTWLPIREYELYDAVWKRLFRGPQANYTQDIIGLKKLALDLLTKKPYPWRAEQLIEAGLSDQAAERLCSVGWLRKTGRGSYEIPHDRLLNWAIAEALVSARDQNQIDHAKLLDVLRLIYHGDHTYSGRSLNYVPMDVLWMLACREGDNDSVVEDIVEVLQPPPAHESGLFYGQLLSTIGASMTLPLISRLRKVSDKDFLLVTQIINGITSLGSEELPEQANALLMDDLPRNRRAAMRLLANSPTAKALDRLWALHIVADKDTAPFQNDNGHRHAVYRDSFRALSACLKCDPSWIKRAIRTANPEIEPVHDLAYLLAGLEGGEQIWQACKSDLFAKIPTDKERSLARCIYRYRDEGCQTWLEDRIDREEDLIGEMCMLALAVIEPAAAIQGLDRMPSSSRYMTRGWATRELLLRSPSDTQVALLDIIRNVPDPWGEAHVYQGSENEMDCATLEFLLDETCSLLREIQGHPPEDAKHPLWIPLSMLAAIHDIDLLQCFGKRKGSELELLLTEWMLSRDPRQDRGADTEGQHGLAVLRRIGGNGFSKAVNALLGGDSQYGRLDGTREAAMRYDAQTMRLLRQIVVNERLWDDKFPLEQDRAARALAIHEDWHSVLDAIKIWGVKTSPDLAQAIHEARLEGKLTELSDVATEWLAGGTPLSTGKVMLLGLLGVGEALEWIQQILGEAVPASEMAVACVLALGYLGLDDKETVSLLAQQLTHHRFAAANALLTINTPPALQALMANIREHPEVSSLLPLLSRKKTHREAISLLQELLRESHGFDLRMKLPLVVSETDETMLVNILTDPILQERVREEAFLDEGSFWIGGSKAAAIRCLATFDSSMAFLAAETALRNKSAHDRSYYASLLMDIDSSRAVNIIVDQAGEQESPELCRSFGRALEQVDVMERLEQCVQSVDDKARLAACRLLPWQKARNLATGFLQDMLDDPCEDVMQAARYGLKQLSQRKQADVLLVALSAEIDKGRWWIIADSAIALADPGDDHGQWPQWARDVCCDLPYLRRLYVGEQIKHRRKELAKKNKDTI